jgi:hypothetical protein
MVRDIKNFLERNIEDREELNHEKDKKKPRFLQKKVSKTFAVLIIFGNVSPVFVIILSVIIS